MNIFVTFANYLRRQMEVSQACRSFRQMDDHMLHDIGIERCQIEDVVRGRVHA